MRKADGHSAVHLWSLSEEIGIEDDSSGDGLVLTGPDGVDRVPEVSPLVREALRRMQLGPVLLANLAPERGRGCAPDEPLPAAGGDPGLSRVLASITHLVVRTLAIDDLGGPLLSAFPLSRSAPFTPVRPPPRRAVRMASGVSLTQESGGIAMWSAAASHRVLLHRPEAALVASLLGWPVTPEDAADALPVPGAVPPGVIGYLTAAGMARPVLGPAPGRTAPRFRLTG
ncbi:NADH oxidase [Streptomyces albidoflavus]|uniref:NADH oxidase n=1 Tax=Streptomyces albidoflavus TaxID=1886 RepID=UPI000FF2A9E3|nr:NADH oxidase [Streptomyces albidoflavus]RWZ77080.1 NADH oxidase [Streptomyces albidoflavus]